MESRLKDKGRGYNAPVVAELKDVGKKSVEWDLNDWKWDGDLFTASPINSIQAECRSRQLFPATQGNLGSSGFSNGTSSLHDATLGQEKDKRELEKRRRIEGDTGEMGEEVGALSLNLGDQVYPIEDAEKGFGKRTKIVESTPTRAVCQVDGCRADLSNAKDYHRRHKVCEVHSKASESLVGNVMQRFCQQCSRFHVLQEFDEEKRSCRRRLAGHNRRRRKTHPDTTTANVGSLSEESSSNYLLISLLRILANMHPSSVDQTKDQDILSHLLRNLAGTNGQNLSGILQETENQGISSGIPEKTPDATGNGPKSAKALGSTSKMDDHSNVINSIGQCLACPVSNTMQRTLHIDLNSIYDESQECMDNMEQNQVPGVSGNGSLSLPTLANQGTRKSSPPITSTISNSTSSQSPSSSSEEAQSRTDRIVFKLFGKDPSDIPLVLRTQILDWLSQSPTDIESHIRPGCILLTVYLRMEKFMWEELLHNLGVSLRRLLDASDEPFWVTGWIYVRVQQSVAFISNGQVVIETPLPLTKDRCCKITSIKPIAVTESANSQFLVKGFNICRSTSRLLCVLDGKYLAQESCYDLMGGAEPYNNQDKLHSLSFSCSIPKTYGRGFIEVEDHGLNSSFFPFIIAEEEVCSEIRVLEDIIEVDENSTDISEKMQKAEARNQALDFLNEMGWLLHRGSRLRELKHNLGFFPFKRFKWLMEFSIEHDWCAVVRKLLGMLFDGVVDAGEHPSVHLALLKMGLLHRAVQKGSQRMVEFLLWYAPEEVLVEQTSERKENTKEHQSSIFPPDAAGPGGLTPLHLVASRDGSEHILDALTNDPKSIGIKAWKSARDNSGLTPNDYACLRGYNSYINLVQRKINATSWKEHVIVHIPADPMQTDHKSGKALSLRIEKSECGSRGGPCKLCEQKLAYGATRAALSFRPAVLSLVAIAAVCVCAALLFKSSPKVLYVFQPFRWDQLKYGSM